MANKWIEHIKKWAKDNNSTYGCALSNPKCKEDYKKSKEEPKQEDIDNESELSINKVSKPKKITKKSLLQGQSIDNESELSINNVSKPKKITKKSLLQGQSIDTQKIQKAIINILEPNKANKPEIKKIDKKKLYEEDIKEIKSELNHKEDRGKRDYKINWRTMQYYADIDDYMKIINDENISIPEKKIFIRNQYEIKDNYLRDQLLKELN